MTTCKPKLHNLYEGKDVAQKYITKRFASEIGRLVHDRQVGFVNRVVQSVQPNRILEIAPGPGRLTRDVNSTGELFCLEYNRSMIEEGRSFCGNATQWVQGDGFELPFPQVFDLVYSFRFIRHFHRSERERLYSEVRRVLRPKGYFLLDAVNEKFSKALRVAHPEQYPIYDKLYRKRELRRELVSAGFEPLAINPVQKCYPCQYWSQILLGPRANWANRLLLRTVERVPAVAGLEWVITCRRV
jgi:ubiquinone/menaquinone biosynthesis C-methylase UbiE